MQFDKDKPRRTLNDTLTPVVPKFDSTPTPPPTGNEPPRKKGLMILVAVLAIALVAAAVALVLLNKKSAEHEALAAQNAAQVEELKLTNEQLQLANEYQALNVEYAQYENQMQRVANDSLNLKYLAAKQNVEKLLAELNSEKTKSAAQIKKLQDEISTLKSILRHYVGQIDSLNRENEGLKAENAELSNQNQTLSSQVQNVSRQNEALNERMTLAEKLNVTGITLQGLKKNGKREKNITKAKQLMVTFTIPKNNSTPVGMKKIYMRITTPEGDLLGNGGTFSFEGGTLASTAHKSVEYQGEEIPNVTIYYDVTTTLNPGQYRVELFADNYRLGSKVFTMKK